MLSRWKSRVPRSIVAVLVGASLLTSFASAAPARAECTLRLGFAELAEVIPDFVGSCIGDETHAPNGDALQLTTGGMLVWRKADNWTAFTDGDNTWINGPGGVAVRPNGLRFPWEPDFGLFVTPLAVGDSWSSDMIDLTVRKVEVGRVGTLPTVTVTYTITNRSTSRLVFTVDHEKLITVVDDVGKSYPLECCITQPQLQVTLQPGESLNRFAQYEGDPIRPGVTQLTVTFVKLVDVHSIRWIAPVQV